MSKTNMLALDIATSCGWCTEKESGVWDFSKQKRADSYGIRLLRLKAKLKEMIEANDINVVVYERPAGMFKSSIMVASEMVSVVIVMCEEMGIDYTAYSASEIKKFWTGKGNANKQAMIDETQKRYPELKIQTDDQADAIALYHLAKKDLNL